MKRIVYVAHGDDPGIPDTSIKSAHIDMCDSLKRTSDRYERPSVAIKKPDSACDCSTASTIVGRTPPKAYDDSPRPIPCGMDDELPHSISRGPGWVEPIPGQRKPCGHGHLYYGRSIGQQAVEALDDITPWALYAERNPLSTDS